MFINTGGTTCFLNYIFFGGQWWLINREGLTNPDLTLQPNAVCT